MTHVIGFLNRLKNIRKGEAGLPPRQMRDSLLAEYMGPAMHAKLNQVHRARKKSSCWV